MTARLLEPRAVLLRPGVVLESITVGYNAPEGIVAIVAGLARRPVALTGFGVHSVLGPPSRSPFCGPLPAHLGARKQGHNAE